MSALDDLRAAYAMFKSLPPIVVAVWCVDRPDVVWRMRDLCRPSTQGTMPDLAAVPVFEWYSRYADDADWARRPECFKTPGVYMEFNNGQYVGVAM